jgi:hypothetical protein
VHGVCGLVIPMMRPAESQLCGTGWFTRISTLVAAETLLFCALLATDGEIDEGRAFVRTAEEFGE